MNNRRVSAFLGLVLLCSISLHAAPDTPPLAFSDFTVNSENASYKYLGKGFSELIAFELKKSPSIRLVEREKRNQLLEEMKFSMTGLTDEASQLEMGKLLAVRYLVSGEITDMGSMLLVSLSMIDVETGEIVWADQVTESGGKYGYIGAYFGKSILIYFKAGVSKSTEAAIEKPVEKDETAVVALSEGIAAFDEGKKDEAKKSLEKAKRFDPTNAVVSAYLDKLASASAKFKVVPERYVSYYNPAYLAGMEKDRAYIDYSYGNVAWGEPNAQKGDSHDAWVILNADKSYATFDRQQCFLLGYQLPLSDRLGLGFEFSAPSLGNSLQQPWSDSWMVLGNDYYSYYGGKLACGLQLSPGLSLGIGFGAAYRRRSYSNDYLGDPPSDQADPEEGDYWLKEDVDLTGMLAAAVTSPSGALAWDIVASWSNETLYYFDTDPAVRNFVGYVAPLYIEQTLAWSPNGQRTFLALKQANDIYFDRDLYYGRIMPCFEQWFMDRFSLRAGIEGTLFARNGGIDFGWGGTAGATVRVWKLDIDANYTLRMRPSRTLDEVIIPESVFFITVAMNGLIKQ